MTELQNPRTLTQQRPHFTRQRSAPSRVSVRTLKRQRPHPPAKRARTLTRQRSPASG